MSNLRLLACALLALASVATLAREAHAGCPAGLVPPAGFAVIPVVNNNNNGAGSLRLALAAAGPSTFIRIMPAVCGKTIRATSPLPALTAGQQIIGGCPAGNELVVKREPNAGGFGLAIASSQNRVCGLAFASWPRGGIAVSGSDNVIDGNVVVASGGPGILVQGVGNTLGTRVLGNAVGLGPLGTAAPRGNCLDNGLATCAGIVVNPGAGTTDDTEIAGNVVLLSGTVAAGPRPGILVLSGFNHEIRDNLVGIDGAGAAGLGNSGAGIRVVGSHWVLIRNNRLAGNHGAGLELVEAWYTWVLGNQLGANSAGAPLGNGGDGISIAGGYGITLGSAGDGNIIRSNGGAGIAFESALGNALSHTVDHNVIADNAGAGVSAADDTSFVTLVDNRIERNGDYGVYVSGRASDVRLTRNAIADNACAVRVERGGNGDLGAPVILSVEDDGAGTTTITGLPVGPVAPGYPSATDLQAQRVETGYVEVFYGTHAGAEASVYLGSVDVLETIFTDETAFEWQLQVPTASLPAGAIVVANYHSYGSYDSTALSELCDGLDQDCDGIVDGAFDWDGDGYTTCGVTPAPSDCDDGDANANPYDGDGDGVSMCPTETSSTLDYFPDDPAKTTSKRCTDSDNDRYYHCPLLCGHAGAQDPDDQDDAVVAALEACNGSDDNADGMIDESFDDDGDGYTTCGLGRVDGTPGGVDCDDLDPLRNPGAVERCGNGLDDDCDGALPVDEDTDGDGDGLALGCVGIAGPIDDNDSQDRDLSLTVRDDDRDGADSTVDCEDRDPSLNLLDFDHDGRTSCAGDCDDSDPQQFGCFLLRGARTLHVTVDRATGAFSPPIVVAHPGDTVRWHFQTPPYGQYATDSIVPVAWDGGTAALCEQALPAFTDDLGGPDRRAVPGIAVISPTENGYREETLGAIDACCAPGRTDAVANGLGLCDAAGPLFAVLPSTWSDPRVSTISLRLSWERLNPEAGRYDFADLDREMEQAVANGKMVSIGIIGGKHAAPEWIFSEPCDDFDTGPVLDPITLAPRPGVWPLEFADGGDDLAADSCGSTMILGSPADPMFQCHYKHVLRAVGEHLQRRADWYQAIAQVKITGANMFTEENRLPVRCKCGCICNPQVWATAPYGALTQASLAGYYTAIEAELAHSFPGKDLDYMLIQGGLPIVDSPTSFKSCCAAFNDGDVAGVDYDCPADNACALDAAACALVTTPTVSSPERMMDIFDDSIASYGSAFIVQHNGMGPLGVRVPNDYVLRYSDGRRGEQPTGFQDNNLGKIITPTHLQATLENTVRYSDGFFLEIYEATFWQAVQEARELVDPTLGPRFEDYMATFAERREELAAAQGWGVDEAYPLTYEHTFSTVGPIPAPLYYPYVHAAGCRSGGTPTYGLVMLIDD